MGVGSGSLLGLHPFPAFLVGFQVLPRGGSYLACEGGILGWRANLRLSLGTSPYNTLDVAFPEARSFVCQCNCMSLIASRLSLSVIISSCIL